RRPKRPMRGSGLPVCGNRSDACSAVTEEAGVGAGSSDGRWNRRTPTIRGVAGAGGTPTMVLLLAVTVSVSSVTMVAWKDIPFLRSNTDFCWPFTVNWAWLGTLNTWFSPPGSETMTVLGALTCHTLPVRLRMVLT